MRTTSPGLRSTFSRTRSARAFRSSRRTGPGVALAERELSSRHARRARRPGRVGHGRGTRNRREHRARACRRRRAGGSSDAVERMVAETEREFGPIQLLVANAGLGNQDGATWEVDPHDWWRVLEVNLLGVHLCCRAVIPGMLERGEGRIVITGSGAAYLPGSSHTAYPASKAGVCRYGETLNNELGGRIPVFFFSPGLVKTEMTSG